VPVHCVQDAAPELRAMVEALERALPADMEAVVLVDFEHLMVSFRRACVTRGRMAV